MTYSRIIPEGADGVIVWAYKKGKTLQEIGDFFGVTRERIRQIMRRNGCDAEFGGSSIRSFVKQSEKRRRLLEQKQKRVLKQEAYFGCSYDFVLSLCELSPWGDDHAGRKSPVAAYIRQRHSAKDRGIEWRMTLPEWWRIWQESGKWEQRGRGPGYGMCRLGDTGGYTPDNVYIATCSENVKDFHAVAENKARWRAAIEEAKAA